MLKNELHKILSFLATSSRTHGTVLPHHLQSRIVHRICQCNLEFQNVNEVSNDNINKNCIEGVLAWLSIHLLIRTGNDKEYVRSLVEMRLAYHRTLERKDDLIHQGLH